MLRWPYVPLLALMTVACADRNEAGEIRDQIRADDYRQTYARAPGWDMPRQPSAGGPHGSFVDIYVSEEISDALEAGEPLTEWPEGSIIVKDGWSAASGGDFEYFAFMERREDGWFWGEYRGTGRLVAAGLDDRRCAGCHASGDDQVRAFGLPR